MSDSMKLRLENRDKVVSRLRKLSEKVAPDSPAIKAALIRSATIILNQAKINVRRQGLIDEGRLINSLRFEFFRNADSNGVKIGSFGVPYAAFWEFGFKGNQSVRAHNRLITQAFGKKLSPSVTARIRQHTRSVDQAPRSYLRPAFEAHKSRVVEIIKKAMEG